LRVHDPGQRLSPNAGSAVFAIAADLTIGRRLHPRVSWDYYRASYSILGIPDRAMG